MRLRRVCLVTLILPALFLTILHSQNDTDTEGRTVFHAVVRTVVVDVVVTDNKNQPVAGLPKEAFQLTEQGQPQKVSFFEEHTGVASAQTSSAKLPPGVFSNVPASKSTDSVNVLLVDSLNTPLADQSYVHSQTIKYLDGIQPGTRIGIFALSTRLRFVQGFTADASMLKAALNNPKLGGGPHASGLLPTVGENAGTQQMVSQIESYQATTASSGFGAAGELQDSIDALKQFQSDTASFQTSQRIEITLDAMQQLGRYLAGIPGRKNVIWFAGSFPLAILPQSVVNQNGQNARQSPSTSPFSSARDFDEKIRQTTELLTAAQVALYPVAAKGVSNIGAYEAQSQSNGLDSGGKGLASSAEPQTEALDVNATQNAMEEIAHDSGGEAFFNTNDLSAAISHAVDHGTHYYTLAYTPTDKTMDGKFRHIDVKLNDGKYKLAFRRGYYTQDPRTAAKEASQRISDPLHPFMGRGMPDSSEIPYTIRIDPSPNQPIADTDRAGDSQQLKGPVTRYAVTFTIPVDSIRFDTGPDGVHHTRLEVAIVAYDYNGKALNWMVRTIALDPKPDRWIQIQQSGVRFRLEEDVPRNNVYLRTGVFDAAANRAGTIEVPMSAVEVAAK